VSIRQDGQPLAEVASAADGNFEFRGMRPGLYQLVSNDETVLYRVWAPETAPPIAASEVVLVRHDPPADLHHHGLGRRFLISGLIITSGMIGGIIGYNIKDNDTAS